MTGNMPASGSKAQRCRAKRTDGTPCAALALPTGRYCWAHDPELAEQRRQARAKGGAATAKQARLAKLIPPRLIDVYDKLETALEEVHDGSLNPRAASAMASLAGAMVRVLTSGELEERVRRLEEGRYGSE